MWLKLQTLHVTLQHFIVESGEFSVNVGAITKKKKKKICYLTNWEGELSPHAHKKKETPSNHHKKKHKTPHL